MAKTIKLEMTPREANVVLRALGSHADNPEADRMDSAPLRWVGDRLTKLLLASTDDPPPATAPARPTLGDPCLFRSFAGPHRGAVVRQDPSNEFRFYFDRDHEGFKAGMICLIDLEQMKPLDPAQAAVASLPPGTVLRVTAGPYKDCLLDFKCFTGSGDGVFRFLHAVTGWPACAEVTGPCEWVEQATPGAMEELSRKASSLAG